MSNGKIGSDIKRNEVAEMKKIELRDLERMGATDRQIEAYNETDPLRIYLNEETGEYSMNGIEERVEMTAQDVLDMLDSLRDSWDEE